jgi:catechol 2,3-dioxygenase-like lactoylglutathione lyase family enzyme
MAESGRETLGATGGGTVELNSVIFYVNDLAAAVRFYRDLLGLSEIFADEMTCTLTLGTSMLVLHRSQFGPQGPKSLYQSSEGRPSEGAWPNCGPEVAAGRHALRFNVEDPDTVVEYLARNGVHVLEPAVDYWWGRCALVADPDGRPVALARMAFSIPVQNG